MLTADKVLSTYNKAIRKLRKDPAMIAVEESIGFLDGKTSWLMSGKAKGAKMQVFIKVYRYSDDLLKKKPVSGGLFAK